MKFALGFLSGTIITIFAAGSTVLGALGYALIEESKKKEEASKENNAE